MIKNDILKYSGIIKEENIIEWEKFIKKTETNKKYNSPYGKIIPNNILEIGDKLIYLPNNYEEFINFLKKKDMKNITELDGAVLEFKKRRK